MFSVTLPPYRQSFIHESVFPAKFTPIQFCVHKCNLHVFCTNGCLFTSWLCFILRRETEIWAVLSGSLSARHRKKMSNKNWYWLCKHCFVCIACCFVWYPCPAVIGRAVLWRHPGRTATGEENHDHGRRGCRSRQVAYVKTHSHLVHMKNAAIVCLILSI